MRRAFAYIACALVALVPGWVFALDGVVVDGATGRGIAQAVVVADGEPLRTDALGHFSLDAAPGMLAARAVGYRAQTVTAATRAEPLRIALNRFAAKAVYLSPYGIADAGLRSAALELAARTEVNALVIDVKGDRSIVPFASASYTAHVGPQTPVTVADIRALLRDLHARGLYLIARIVVFKDDRLASAHPEWAVRDHAGAVWKDREQLAWIDPFRRDAWGFSLGVAEEAARLGFDEIQFDYLRFPDEGDLRFAERSDAAARVAAIGAFLDAARERLARWNVFVAADIFGYVCWTEGDLQIGQDLDDLVARVDYVSPMLYPSGFTFGIPGVRDPVAHPGEIVQRSLQRALQRSGAPPATFRPWLQAFRDYAFDRREFDGEDIRAQIDAGASLGIDGWMLWNAHNRYGTAGLRAPAGDP